MRLGIDDILADLDRIQHSQDQAHAVNQKDEQQHEEHLLHLLTTFQPQHELIQALSHSRSLLLTTDPIDSLHPRIAHIQSALDHRSQNWAAAIQHLSLPLSSLPPLSLSKQQQPQPRSLPNNKRKKVRRNARQALWHDDDSWQAEKLAVQRAISEDHIDIPQQPAVVPPHTLAPPLPAGSTISRSSSLSLQPEQSQEDDEDDDEEDDAWAFEDSHQGDSHLNSPLPPASSTSPVPPSTALSPQPSHQEGEEEDDDAWTFDQSSPVAAHHPKEEDLSVSKSAAEVTAPSAARIEESLTRLAQEPAHAQDQQQQQEGEDSWNFDQTSPVAATPPETLATHTSAAAEVPEPSAGITAPSVAPLEQAPISQHQEQQEEEQDESWGLDQTSTNAATEPEGEPSDTIAAAEVREPSESSTGAPLTQSTHTPQTNHQEQEPEEEDDSWAFDQTSSNGAPQPEPTTHSSTTAAAEAQADFGTTHQEVEADEADDAWTFDDVVPSPAKDAGRGVGGQAPQEATKAESSLPQTAPALALQGAAVEDEEEDAWDL
ncbi:hypothetical protein OC845_001817 [Tilletia horrida]|nr:hypothetical protein OC845_001817 [Tilletia horrida]